jgi:hypothetical protein
VAFSLSLTSVKLQTGERWRLAVKLDVKDDGKDFFACEYTWSDLPTPGADYIALLLEEMMGEPTPINLQNLTIQQVLQAERKLTHAIQMLNLIGTDLVGQDSDNKKRFAEKKVKSLKKGKS